MPVLTRFFGASFRSSGHHRDAICSTAGVWGVEPPESLRRRHLRRSALNRAHVCSEACECACNFQESTLAFCKVGIVGTGQPDRFAEIRAVEAQLPNATIILLLELRDPDTQHGAVWGELLGAKRWAYKEGRLVAVMSASNTPSRGDLLYHSNVSWYEHVAFLFA